MRKLRHSLSIVILASTLSACFTPQTERTMTTQNNVQENTNDSNEREVTQSNTAEYIVNPVTTEKKADYAQATRLYSQLTIAYTSDGYFDRAKEKLIKAQELAKEHGYDFAIVDYAAGYYYQAIGVNSAARKHYEEALDNHPKDFEAMNFYAQFLCQQTYDFKQAQDLFDKSLYISNNDDMAQTLLLYSECMYRQGDKNQAIKLMERANRFRTDYKAAKLRLAEMYFEKKEYRKCYSVIYSMKDDKQFFNNRRILQLRLKLAEYAHNKSEAAAVRLILSSRNYNNEDMNKFFSEVDQQEVLDNDPQNTVK